MKPRLNVADDIGAIGPFVLQSERLDVARAIRQARAMRAVDTAHPGFHFRKLHASDVYDACQALRGMTRKRLEWVFWNQFA